MSRIVKILIGCLLFVLIAFPATPKLLSTDYVKERISRQISDLTGLPVSLSGGSLVALSPYLSVSYTNVKIGERPQNGRALLEMDALQATLGLWPALRGEARLVGVHMLRPRFNLSVDSSGQTNWGAATKQFSKVVRSEDGDHTEDLTLASISFENGVAELNDARSRRTQTATSLSGNLNWPGLSSAFNGNVTAIWRGEAVNLGLSAASPDQLISGQVSPVAVTFQSAPMQLNFEGDVSALDRTLAGQMTVSTASVRRLAEWMDLPLSVAELLSDFSVSGPVTATEKSLEFPEASVRIGQHKANGRLQFLGDGKQMPIINGTLAFDTVAMPGLPGWLTSINETDPATTGEFNPASFHDYSLDLRLSANSVENAAFNIQNLAASIIIREGKASLDIGQAETLEGLVTGSVSMEGKQQFNELTTNLVFEDIELGEFTKLAPQSQLQLTGKGNANIRLRSQGRNAQNFVERMNGEISIKANAGTLAGINFYEIWTTANERPEKIWGDLEGTTPFEMLDIQLLIANGTSFFRGTTIESDVMRVSLGGRGDLAEGSLALRGQIDRINEESTDLPTRLPFFVGGTLSAPLFVPLPVSSGGAKPEETTDDNQTPTATDQ